jgi:Spy/CpxP family protein refolding chaperone
VVGNQQQELIIMFKSFGNLYSTKTLIRAGLAALSIATIGSVADAANARGLRYGQHQGPYDNTGHGPQQSGLEGGGGS